MTCRVELRPLRPAQARAMAELRVAERDHIAPTDPCPAEDWDLERMTARLARADEDRARGHVLRYGIHADGSLVGGLSLADVGRDPLRRATVGYWVARPWTRRGIARRALALAVEEAFGPLGLHRLEAGVKLDNVASQRVLAANGFRLVGISRAHLLLAGRWTDHALFERLAAPAPAVDEPVEARVAGLDRLLP